jgi:transposase
VETDPQKMAALMLGLTGVVVLEAREDRSGVWIEVEPEAKPVSCPACGRPAAITGSESVERRGLPLFGRPSVMSWRLRRFGCSDPGCGSGEWLEELPASAGRDGGQA